MDSKDVQIMIAFLTMTTREEFIIVVIYVDDILTGSTTTTMGDNFIKYLREVCGSVTEQTWLTMDM